MYTPDFLIIKNLFTHEHTVYKFNKGVMTMMLGINATESGSDSNGAGKSTIIEGVTLACTGEVYRGVNKEDFIRTGCKSAYTEFQLKNFVLKETLNIKRTFYLNKSSDVVITVNKEVIFESGKDRTKTSDPNRIIFEKFGFSKEDFLNYFIIGQDNDNSFFTATDTKQKEIIGRFSNFAKLDEVLVGVCADIAALEVKLNQHQIDLGRVNGKIEAAEEQRTQIIEDFEQTNTEELESSKQAIEDARAKVVKYSKELDAIKETHNILEKAYTDIKFKSEVEDEEGWQDLVRTHREKIEEYNSELKGCSKYLGELENLTGKSIVCPKCNKAFIPNSKLTPVQVASQIEEVEQMVVSLKESIRKRNNKLLKAEGVVESIKQNKYAVRLAKQKVDLSSQRIVDIEIYVNQANKKIKEVSEIFNSLKAKQQTVEKATAQVDKNLESYKNSKIEVESEIELVNEVIAEKKFFEFHFGKKGLKTFLANKSIRNIQDICNFYLKKFDTDLQVLVSGYKVDKKGNLSDKITVQVLQGGVKQGMFKKYSGGEKSRVNICGILTLNSLINNSVDYGKGLDLLALDENTSGLDKTGKRQVIEIMKKVDITSLLVLHEVEDVPYSYKTIITKTDGISKIQNIISKHHMYK